MSLTLFARPKVNLFLHVTGKRADGYHLLESLVCFPGGGDVLTVSPAKRLRLREAGPYAGAMGAAEDNLVHKAATMLQTKFGISAGAEIALEKNMPVASGIGGGSSDAAAALHLLRALWRLEITEADLAAAALPLGADMPVCVHGKPSLITGIGETVTEVSNLPDLYILLVNPGVPVSTPPVFSALKDFSPSQPDLAFSNRTAADFVQNLRQCRNDLQTGAMGIAPEIGETLKMIAACRHVLLHRMSGSGATCYGLFDTAADAEAAKEKIARARPGWWIAAAALQAKP